MSMRVYEAIEQMRSMSAKGEMFSFSFMSYSYSRKKSEGVVTVEHARLTKQSRAENNRFSQYMLNYMDMDTMETHQCWQPLLLELNGEPLILD